VLARLIGEIRRHFGPDTPRTAPTLERAHAWRAFLDRLLESGDGEMRL
jgi:hypothetical protein